MERSLGLWLAALSSWLLCSALLVGAKSAKRSPEIVASIVQVSPVPAPATPTDEISKSTPCASIALNHVNEGDGTVFSMGTGIPVCVLVGFLTPVQSHVHLDAFLASSAALVPAQWTGCVAAPQGLHAKVHGARPAVQSVCGFAAKVEERGSYNLTLRTNDLHSLGITSLQKSIRPLDALGFVMGRDHEVQMHPQRLVAARSAAHHKQRRAARSRPPCSFQHEVEMYHGRGNARWLQRPLLSPAEGHTLRDIWYNDTYVWENDLCKVRPLTADEIQAEAAAKGLRRVLFVGDSLTRFMWGDVEDVFSGFTQTWMSTHPLVLTETDHGNRSSWDNAMSCAGGFGPYRLVSDECHRQTGIIPLRDCCASNNCTDRPLQVGMASFLPGHTSPLEPHFNWPAVPRSTEEYRVEFAKRYVQVDLKPQVLVFNAGLWLVNAFVSKSADELSNMIHGMLRACEENHVLFVWRATFYHHRYQMHALLEAANARAVEELLKRNHTYFLHSNYDMSRLRPDRTVDGFHYNYRMIRKAWHHCTEADVEQMDSDCVRNADWPMSVARGATLHLLNLLLNSHLTGFQLEK